MKLDPTIRDQVLSTVPSAGWSKLEGAAGAGADVAVFTVAGTDTGEAGGLGCPSSITGPKESVEIRAA